MAKKLKKAEVSKGRNLKMLIKQTGSELDEPKEYDTVRTVVKVDGRWIDVGEFSVARRWIDVGEFSDLIVALVGRL